MRMAQRIVTESRCQGRICTNAGLYENTKIRRLRFNVKRVSSADNENFGLDLRKSREPFFLALNSPADEAWQILYHLRSLDNPFYAKNTLAVYSFSTAQSRLQLN